MLRNGIFDYFNILLYPAL